VHNSRSGSWRHLYYAVFGSAKFANCAVNLQTVQIFFPVETNTHSEYTQQTVARDAKMTSFHVAKLVDEVPRLSQKGYAIPAPDPGTVVIIFLFVIYELKLLYKSNV
jgi:hypothetical protein